MAQRLKQNSLTTKVARRRRARIPAEWLQGDPWEIRVGEDFGPAEPEDPDEVRRAIKTMQNDLHNLAQRETRLRGKRVRLHTATAGLPFGTMQIQFVETDEPAPDYLAPKQRPAHHVAGLLEKAQAMAAATGGEVCSGLRDSYPHVAKGYASCPEC